MRSRLILRHLRGVSLYGAVFAALLCAGAPASAGTVLPVAVAEAFPTTVVRGALGRVTFKDDLSYHPDSSRIIVSYEWDFLGDGTYDLLLTNPLAMPVYTYMDPGLFNATLRVTDDQGASGTDSVLITVLHEPEVPPICDAGGPYTFGPNQSLTLSGTALDANVGDVLTAAWDIDLDGQYGDAAGLTPTIPFTTLYPLALGQPGRTFAISLRVTDQTGRASYASASVSFVVPSPNAVWMGAGLLGAMVVLRELRRKRQWA